MTTFKAIMINPATRTIEACVMHEADQLAQFYAHLDCQAVDALSFPNGDTAWIDDEGLFQPNQSFFYLPHLHHDPIAGCCIVTGTRWGNNGDNLADCQSTVAELVASIRWLMRINVAA